MGLTEIPSVPSRTWRMTIPNVRQCAQWLLCPLRKYSSEGQASWLSILGAGCQEMAAVDMGYSGWVSPGVLQLDLPCGCPHSSARLLSWLAHSSEPWSADRNWAMVCWSILRAPWTHLEPALGETGDMYRSMCINLHVWIYLYICCQDHVIWYHIAANYINILWIPKCATSFSHLLVAPVGPSRYTYDMDTCHKRVCEPMETTIQKFNGNRI
jgi:hypothetical protein